MSKVTRKLFSERDDNQLKKLVKKFGDQDWELISDKIKKFSPRQCKDRYTVYLSGNFRNDPWTPEEDALLSKLYKEHGPKWCEICKFFDGRHSNSVKNRWHRYIKPKELEMNNDNVNHETHTNQVSSPEMEVPAKQEIPQDAFPSSFEPQQVTVLDKQIVDPLNAFDKNFTDDMFSNMDLDNPFFNDQSDLSMFFF